MKTFSTFSTLIQPQINIHFLLEFNLQDSLLKSYVNINETYGVYKGQLKFIIDLADMIAEDVDNNIEDEFITNKQMLEENGYENIFFNELRVIYNKQCQTYYNNKVTYNDNTKLFEVLEIYINTKDSNYKNIVIDLAHELTHAWEDYNRYINKDKSLKYIYNNTSYKELIKTSNNVNDLTAIVKRVEYQLQQFEINAYISEIKAELTSYKEPIKDYKDALKIFKNNDTYQAYLALATYIDNLNGDLLARFTDIYNKINDTSFTENKLIKKLKNRFAIVNNKIERLLPKIYYEYFDNQRTNESNRQSMGIIDLIKYRMTNNNKLKYIRNGTYNI